MEEGKGRVKEEVEMLIDEVKIMPARLGRRRREALTIDYNSSTLRR